MTFSHMDTFWVVNWTTDVAGQCDYIDRQWPRITGQTAEAAMGGGWLDAIHQDDLERVKVELGLASGSERPFQIVARLRRQDGQFRWALAVGAPRYDAQDVFIGYSGSIIDFHDRTDITERKERLDALRASQERDRPLFETSRDGIVTVDMSGRILEANPAYQKMLGYTLEELKRLTYQELTPEVWHDMEAAVVREHILPRGESAEYEKEYIRKDGTVFPISLRTWTVVDESGHIVGMRAFVRDITERKQAEAALRDSEERFRVSFANASIGFAMNGPDDTHLDANRAYCVITGYTREELLALKASELIHPDDWPANRALSERMLAGEIPGFVVENRYVRKNGENIWVRKSVSLVRSADGEPRWIITLVEDVTERKLAEEALQQSRNDLDRAQEVGKIGWWRLDVRRNVLTWSDENHRIFGVPKGTPLTYDSFLSIVHPDDRADVDAKWQAGLRGEPYDVEHRIMSGDEVKWVREKAYLEFDAAGALLGGFGITQDITERKQAEEALRESEARLRLATEASKIGAFDWRIPTDLNIWTPELEAMYGLAPGEFGRKRSAWEQLVHQDDRAGAVAKVNETLETGEPVEHEWRVVWPDGSVHWIAGRFQGFKDAVGKPVRLTGVNIDVSERKRVEEALRKSELRYRSLVEAASAVTWSCQPSGLHQKPQQEWMAFTGQTAEEMLDDGWTKVVHPDDLEAVAAKWRTAVARAEPFWSEHRIRRHDGEWRWMRVQAAPIRDATGEIVEWFGSNTDINDLKQAELALRESQQQLALALEAGQLGFWDWHLPSGRVQFGGSWASMLGYELSEMEPDVRAWERLIHPDEREAIAARLSDHLEGRAEIYECEHRLLHKDGSWRWILDRGRVVERDAAGRPIRAIGTHADVTARHEAEAALQDADRRKDEFLATLAHELRNPLTPIRNAVHILKKKYGPQFPDTPLLAMVQRQVDHLVRLVDDLLEISRISRGKVDLRKENVAVSDFLRHALESCQPLIDNKSHRVIVNIADEPLRVFGDSVRLAQIAANIINNAAKYTPSGGRIEIDAARGGDEVVLRVRDNGVGISADMMPRVFDLFAQTDGQIRLSEGGLGIGLALVRSLVEVHGGRVEARSEGVGRGSEFVVSLPLAGCRGPRLR
ncbi:PAS domain S-box protein [Methylocystis sp. SC2]|uniref:PAS domain S-box protein n=1 Tax=Methylocystis sp. (strain SC2) TaxID=187303 RepID=UPI00027AEDAD|nr:PAS domain S-box protein [Methylocystis sp. SC2]CCJ08159.1 Putative PAS/PAC sensor signal transduction histidine kinase [Methylocystis sp. SC2]